MLTTTELIAILVRLKFRLGFRSGTGTQAFAIAAMLFLGVLGTVSGVVAVLWTRGAIDSSTQLMLLLTSICLLWFVFAVISGSGESVLDPGLFALYPVSVRQLVVALLAAAFVGVAAPGTAVVALLAVSHASGLVSGVLIALGAVVVTLTAVLSGRYGLAVMSSLVRGRGTREVDGLFAVVVGSLAGLAPQFLFGLSEFFDESKRSSVRSFLRWVPWGWGPEGIASAAQGNHRSVSTCTWYEPRHRNSLLQRTSRVELRNLYAGCNSGCSQL